MKVTPRQRYIITALLLAAFVLLVLLIALVLTPHRNMLTSDSTTRYMQPSSEMRTLIHRVFTSERSSITYSRYVEEDILPRLIERSQFSIGDTPYVAELVSKKSEISDETYNTVESLTLALNALNAAGDRDEIVFVDTYADGVLDAVYMNGTRLTSSDILIEAQTKYAEEIDLIGGVFSF